MVVVCWACDMKMSNAPQQLAIWQFTSWLSQGSWTLGTWCELGKRTAHILQCDMEFIQLITVHWWSFQHIKPHGWGLFSPFLSIVFLLGQLFAFFVMQKVWFWWSLWFWHIQMIIVKKNDPNTPDIYNRF